MSIYLSMADTPRCTLEKRQNEKEEQANEKKILQNFGERLFQNDSPLHKWQKVY